MLKQADLLMLHHLVPDEVEPGSLAPNLRFYEPRTAHGSSLSPARPRPRRLIEAGQEDDVVGLVIGTRSGRLARRLLSYVALDLLVAVSKPVVLVPPHTAMPFELRRVLVPLDGTNVTAAALTETVALARDAEVELDVLHVHDEDSLPLFSEQPQHETESWAREFLARYCPTVDLDRLHLRVGAPGEHVVRVAEETGADLIALGWAQDLSSGRAAVVREALRRSRVPVLLVPVAAAAPGPPATAPASTMSA